MKRAKMTLPVLGCAVLAVVSCNSDTGSETLNIAERAGSAKGGLAEIVGQSGLPLRDYMVHLVNYNAGQLWKWQATVSDAHGDHLTIPKTEAEWEDAESAALTLRELTRPLHSVGKGDPKWELHLLKLERSISEAADQAEKKNGPAFLASGLKIDNACVECHYEFAAELEQPRPEGSVRQWAIQKPEEEQ